MTSHSKTDTFSIFTVQSPLLHSLPTSLLSELLFCLFFALLRHPPPSTHTTSSPHAQTHSPPTTTAPHTSISQVLHTQVMTLQRQSLPALPSSPLHHFIPPQKPLRPYLLGSCSSASLPASLSLSCFMAVDLLLEHLPSRVRERMHTHTHTQTQTELSSTDLGTWWREVECGGVFACAHLYLRGPGVLAAIIKTDDGCMMTHYLLDQVYWSFFQKECSWSGKKGLELSLNRKDKVKVRRGLVVCSAKKKRKRKKCPIHLLPRLA